MGVTEVGFYELFSSSSKLKYCRTFTFSLFGPISIGGGSPTVLPNSYPDFSSLLCSFCLLDASSLAPFLNLTEMASVPPLLDLSSLEWLELALERSDEYKDTTPSV